MDASMWSKIILIFFYYHVFVRTETSKETIIQGITKKIDTIANALHLQSLSSPSNNMSYILNNLENTLVNTTEKLNPTSRKHVQLIFKGIKLKLLNYTKGKVETSSKENAAKELDLSRNNDQLKLGTVISNKKEPLVDTEPNYTSKEKLSEVASVKQKETIAIRKPNVNLSKRKADENMELKRRNNNLRAYKTSNDHIIPSSCHDISNRTCQDIKYMNRLKCSYEHSYTPLDKLCDGTPDCPFKSDENNCYSQVMDKILYVKQVTASIETNKYCFEHDVDESILAKQAKTLQIIFDNELSFKRKLQNLEPLNKMNEVREAHYTALVISSLALMLDGALCSNKLSFDTRRSNDLFDLDLENEFKESIGSTKSCKCIDELCDNCTLYCKRICKQGYSLTNWNCESLNGADTVPLNLLCDGKFDCFDESDEKGCNSGGYTKFEATEIYGNILNMLQFKAAKQRESTLKKFLLLSDSITKLQKLTTEPVPKTETIKKQRDECFSMLRTIYSDTVTQSDIGNDHEETYLFLLAINQNLVSALKRSHVGNSKIIGNECHCRNGTCSESICTKICAKACAVESRLTKYNCFESNQFVAVDKICNGVEDCSDGYDEVNCKTDEICRRHHLVLLRHNLQRIGDNLKGTSLGELLSSWKLKVISNLRVLEKHDRFTPQTLKRAIKDTIRDLVVSYGSVENYRRRTDYALPEFQMISQLMLESIKSCRK